MKVFLNLSRFRPKYQKVTSTMASSRRRRTTFPILFTVAMILCSELSLAKNLCLQVYQNETRKAIEREDLTEGLEPFQASRIRQVRLETESDIVRQEISEAQLTSYISKHDLHSILSLVKSYQPFLNKDISFSLTQSRLVLSDKNADQIDFPLEAQRWELKASQSDKKGIDLTFVTLGKGGLSEKKLILRFSKVILREPNLGWSDPLDFRSVLEDRYFNEPREFIHRVYLWPEIVSIVDIQPGLAGWAKNLFDLGKTLGGQLRNNSIQQTMYLTPEGAHERMILERSSDEADGGYFGREYEPRKTDIPLRVDNFVALSEVSRARTLIAKIEENFRSQEYNAVENVLQLLIEKRKDQTTALRPVSLEKLVVMLNLNYSEYSVLKELYFKYFTQLIRVPHTQDHFKQLLTILFFLESRSRKDNYVDVALLKADLLKFLNKVELHLNKDQREVLAQLIEQDWVKLSEDSSRRRRYPPTIELSRETWLPMGAGAALRLYEIPPETIRSILSDIIRERSLRNF